MKKITLGALLFIGIIGLAGFVVLSNASENSKTPREVTATMFQAIAQKDEIAFTNTFCDPGLASLVYASAHWHNTITSLTYLKITIDDDKAVLVVTGFAQPTASSSTDPLDWDVYLEKQQQNWCIAGIESKPQ